MWLIRSAIPHRLVTLGRSSRRGTCKGRAVTSSCGAISRRRHLRSGCPVARGALAIVQLVLDGPLLIALLVAGRLMVVGERRVIM